MTLKETIIELIKMDAGVGKSKLKRYKLRNRKGKVIFSIKTTKSGQAEVKLGGREILFASRPIRYRKIPGTLKRIAQAKMRGSI